MRRFLAALATVFLMFLLIPDVAVYAAPRLQDVERTEDKVVIVIDPGHGGKNLGTTQNSHVEKQMTLITAMAMYEELLLYDNVDVYLTRTEDKDVTIKARAEYAAQVDADFLFSIHYNASETHTAYGAEVWVSAFAPYNGYGYQFGYEILSDMREKGLLVRGVKTRLGDKGLDYYGIIRESVALQIPSVIIEHCHVDEEHDTGYCDDEEKLKEFGRMDATAVARYFGLKSKVLQADYSDYALAESSGTQKVGITIQDTTKPDVCQISLSDFDSEKGRLIFSVTASDQDSGLLYYSYSLDGGKNFSAREVWPDSDTLTGRYQETFLLDLDYSPGTQPKVVVRAYNPYDLYTESNCFAVNDKEIGNLVDKVVKPGEEVSGGQSDASGAAAKTEDTPGMDQTGKSGATGSQENGMDVGQPENHDVGDGHTSIEVLPVNGGLAESFFEHGKAQGRLLDIIPVVLGLIGLLLLLLTALQWGLYRSRKKRRIQERKNDGRDTNHKI
jgi:N-acetylmuramoyl-L-alanine amidase